MNILSLPIWLLEYFNSNSQIIYNHVDEYLAINKK
jgi:hypothetical protein